MEAQQFAYWLQGFAELNSGPPSAEQWQAIRDHLQTVFVKVTPNIRIPDHTMPWVSPPQTYCRSQLGNDLNRAVAIC